MGARKDGRIEPGQSLKSAISARAWNRAQDAADLVLGGAVNVAASGPSLGQFAANMVMVRNDTAGDVPMLAVLAIDGVVIDPSGGTLSGSDAASGRAKAFVRKPVVIGRTPTSAIPSTRFVVCMEPIPLGAIGRAAIGGVFPCKIAISNAQHQFATVRNNDFTQLASAQCGVVQIIWKEPGTGFDKWALGAM
jgi:hypothetical protein